MSARASGDVLEAVRHARCIRRQIDDAAALDEKERRAYADELRVPYALLNDTVAQGRLPVVNFAAGGIGMVSMRPIWHTPQI